VSVRGVQPGGLGLHRVRITQGRMFESGRAELVVGRLAQANFGNMQVGATVPINGSPWRIVGVFESNGTVAESEVWGDLAALQSAYRRNNVVQSVRVVLDPGTTPEQLNKWIQAQPQLRLFAQTERAYYSRQSRSLAGFVNALALPVAIMLAVGAIAGALNSLEAAVNARRRIFATLRTFGYGRGLIMFSTLLEALILALTGGLIGFVLARLTLNGSSSSLLSSETTSQVLFAMDVNGGLLQGALTLTLIIGILGGISPALQSGRFALRSALSDQNAAE